MLADGFWEGFGRRTEIDRYGRKVRNQWIPFEKYASRQAFGFMKEALFL